MLRDRRNFYRYESNVNRFTNIGIQLSKPGTLISLRRQQWSNGQYSLVQNNLLLSFVSDIILYLRMMETAVKPVDSE